MDEDVQRSMPCPLTASGEAFRLAIFRSTPSGIPVHAILPRMPAVVGSGGAVLRSLLLGSGAAAAALRLCKADCSVSITPSGQPGGAGDVLVGG